MRTLLFCFSLGPSLVTLEGLCRLASVDVIYSACVLCFFVLAWVLLWSHWKVSVDWLVLMLFIRRAYFAFFVLAWVLLWPLFHLLLAFSENTNNQNPRTARLELFVVNWTNRGTTCSVLIAAAEAKVSKTFACFEERYRKSSVFQKIMICNFY